MKNSLGFFGGNRTTVKTVIGPEINRRKRAFPDRIVPSDYSPNGVFRILRSEYFFSR